VAQPCKALLDRDIQERLRCPVCGSCLLATNAALMCTGPACREQYPIVDGIPILINERESIFPKGDFLRHESTFFKLGQRSALLRTAKKFTPELGCNLRAAQNFEAFLKLVLAASSQPMVLVLGGSVFGEGMASIHDRPGVRFVDTDVSLGPQTKLILDGHSIPFADGTFDGVIAQAVIEHVMDPYRCVKEIHRVLRPGGLVYAETAFMQQVHGGRYDFTRFTHLGHRRLFRSFDELSSGACCGPGTALAWACQYFALSFFTSEAARIAVKVLSRLLLFWLKYFDSYLVKRPGALDAASALYFLGRKNESALPDRQLIQQFRGLAGVS